MERRNRRCRSPIASTFLNASENLAQSTPPHWPPYSNNRVVVTGRKQEFQHIRRLTSGTKSRPRVFRYVAPAFGLFTPAATERHHNATGWSWPLPWHNVIRRDGVIQYAHLDASHGSPQFAQQLNSARDLSANDAESITETKIRDPIPASPQSVFKFRRVSLHRRRRWK